MLHHWTIRQLSCREKIARDFLLKLQQRIGIEKQEYSDALVKELFSETNGDLEMFLEDRSSELVKRTLPPISV